MAQRNHLSAILSEINPVVTETLNYELLIRNIRPAQAPTTKKVQLAREIQKEQQGGGYSIHPFMSVQEDLRCCAALFVQFESSLNSATRTTLSIESAIINLIFLKVRVDRLNAQTQNDSQLINITKTTIENAIKKGKDLLQSSNGVMTGQEEIIDLMGSDESTSDTSEQINIQQLFASLNLNAQGESLDFRTDRRTNNGISNVHSNFAENQLQFDQNVPFSSTNAHANNFNAQSLFDQFLSYVNSNQPHGVNNAQFSHIDPNAHANSAHNANSERPLFNQGSIQNQGGQTYTPPRRDNKIYKWKVKFSGEDSKYDAIDFIQKVNALALSRGVSDRELFDSAIDFFSGQALKWYYAQRSQMKSWSELSEKLISDFIEVNYYDNLLDTIRQRKQTPNESIVHFFTIFEDDCSRLQTPLSQNDKMHIIKKNILQKYRPYVTLKNYASLNEVKHDLKLLEASMPATNERNVNFTAGTSTHTSRFDSYRNNRSYSRSPSNSSNAARTNQASPSRFSTYRPSTPIPSDKNRNTSYDRTEKRHKSPYDERKNKSDLNKNVTRSNSRDSNSSQRFKSPKDLNR